MRITPKRAARALKRRLRPAPTATQNAPITPMPAPPRERVVVRQLVLPKDAQDGPQHISELDRTSLLGRYALPPLERMAPEERAELVDSLLSVQRMETLGLTAEELEFPEASWKLVYNEVWRATHRLGSDTDSIGFTGTFSSELNALLRSTQSGVVHVDSPKLVLDESVCVPSNTVLHGHGVRVLAGDNYVEKVFVLDGAQDVLLDGFELDGCCDYPIYVKNSVRFVVSGMRISRCAHKAICVMGVCRHFVIRDNQVCESGNGGIFLNGDIGHGIIERNVVERAGGTGNFSGAIVLSALDIRDIDTAYNPWQAWDLVSRIIVPHRLVIRENVLRGGVANGLYSHAGYCNYLVSNVFDGNNKEGMCLDFGTCGTYVAENLVSGNGGRFGMDDRQLAEDFIQDFGILPDGSSPAKVPGISLDNACYNVLYQNVVRGNYGTGIKMVRSGARNVVLSNVVADNNAGENDRFHFFGIELSTDRKPDYEEEGIRELDFAPCYENVVARNVISGAHYSGVFIGSDAYVNDCFDNVVMDTPRPFEVVSDRLNARVNNLPNSS